MQKQPSRRLFIGGIIVPVLLIIGCTAFQVGSDIQKGRTALLTGEPKVALAHFQRAAELNPDYVLDFSYLPQGVWTYVGRAYYAQGQFSQARNAFEKARSRHPDDNLAKLYLGLVLARDGSQQQGLQEIQAGLTGLNDWLNHIDQYSPDSAFWDPGSDLRSEIQKNLTMISGKDISWPQLIGSGERLGKKFEEEIDLARRDKVEDLYKRDGDGSSGH